MATARSWVDSGQSSWRPTAHGISVGWFLVFRHVGRGMLTVKAFDGTFFIKEFGQTLTGEYSLLF
jgi:hypothetical protein